jgi:ribosomal protein S18 acetylase RimI-like enzyme
MRRQMIDFLEKLNFDERGKLISIDVAEYVNKILKNATVISIVNNSDLKAFIAFYENDINKKVAFLTMIAVEKESANLGYGKKLLEMSIEEVKKKGFKSYELEVREDNLKAIKLYQNFGFEIIETNRGVFHMIKKL